MSFFLCSKISVETHIRAGECYVETKILLADDRNAHDVALCGKTSWLIRGYAAFFGGVLNAPALFSALTLASS